MQNRPIFIKVKNYVENQGYTIQQIQDVSPTKVKSLLNLTDEEFTQYNFYASGIKLLLINKLQEEIDKQTIDDMKSQINSWLLSKFPNYEIEKDFSDKSNKKIIFHLDGKEI